MHNHNIVATTGTYTGQDGQKKYINKTIGKVLQTQHGIKLKLDASFNLAALQQADDGSVWLAVFPPRDGVKQQEANTQAQSQPTMQQLNDFDDDSIPF